MFLSNQGIQYVGCKCKTSVEINSNVSKLIQAYSLWFNFHMKSPCYLVTLSLESSDFQTFLKQYVILVPLALWFCIVSIFFVSNRKQYVWLIASSHNKTSSVTVVCIRFSGLWLSTTRGGRVVLGKIPVPGRPTHLGFSRARAYCACSKCGWGCLDIFSLVYHFSLLSPSTWYTLPSLLTAIARVGCDFNKRKAKK